jgi:hypothetical protein
MPGKAAMDMKHYPAEGYAEIRDLGLASALVTVGCPLIDHKRAQGGRVYFVFNNTEDFRAAVSAWNDQELDVNARIYYPDYQATQRHHLWREILICN